MTTHHTAQGLASLGRHGDSMLVHMSPHEVAGLNYIAKKQGTKLTTNPDTGLPEAFSLGNFFTSFLPTIVGAAVGGPAGAGFMSTVGAPILAGAATGAGLAALKGDDPLMGGLMGGFGGYGGAGLKTTLGNAFKSATPALEGTAANIGGSGAADAIGTNVLQQTSPGMGGLGFGTQSTLPAISPEGVVTPATTGVATAPLSTTAQIPQNLDEFGTGIKNLSGLNPDMSMSDAYGAFTKAGGTASDILMPVGSGVLAGLEPSDLGYGGDLYNDPDKGKYKGPQGQLNLSDKYDTGLRLVAKGGYINGYALGGAVNTNPSVGGGLSDLYNRSEGAVAESLSNDGYGIGRLNNLANEQSRYQAQTLGYADGGNVGMNMDRLPTLNLETGQQSGGNMGGMPGGLFGAMLDSNPEFAKQLGISENTSPQLGGLLGAMMRKNPEFAKQLGLQKGQYARGGYLNGAGDGMSDSIPATIEGKQPARLADGEFVVPADVVSHLGNGSSKAGSKRLYAMLDKVRQARTGNKKQGKEIKAEKYLPA